MPFQRWFVATSAWIAAAVLLAAALLKTSAAFTQAYHFGQDRYETDRATLACVIALVESVRALFVISYPVPHDVSLIATSGFVCFFGASRLSRKPSRTRFRFHFSPSVSKTRIESLLRRLWYSRFALLLKAEKEL